MKRNNKKYLIINASLVTNANISRCFEFVINEKMEVIEKSEVKSLASLTVIPFKNQCDLINQLFEINHVRIDPKLNNEDILLKFRETLAASGVEIYNVPRIDDMKVLYNPVGELSTIVRFYMNESNMLTFLASTVKLKLV